MAVQLGAVLGAVLYVRVEHVAQLVDDLLGAERSQKIADGKHGDSRNFQIGGGHTAVVNVFNKFQNMGLRPPVIGKAEFKVTKLDICSLLELDSGAFDFDGNERRLQFSEGY